MKTIAVIENKRGKFFSIYTPNLHSTIIGYGQTIEAARNDFLNSYKEIKEAFIDEEGELPSELEDLTFEYMSNDDFLRDSTKNEKIKGYNKLAQDYLSFIEKANEIYLILNKVDPKKYRKGEDMFYTIDLGWVRVKMEDWVSGDCMSADIDFPLEFLSMEEDQLVELVTKERDERDKMEEERRNCETDQNERDTYERLKDKYEQK